MIQMHQLRGLSIERAELYGKPHVGAHYTKGTRYERTQARCCVCGGNATNCHHVIPRGRGQEFALQTPNGLWLLKSPLFAVCGSGTTGCHNGFHGGAFLKAKWVWKSPGVPRRVVGAASCWKCTSRIPPICTSTAIGPSGFEKRPNHRDWRMKWKRRPAKSTCWANWPQHWWRTSA